MNSRWARIARRIIGETLARLPADASERERRRALSEAYPFGERRYHPYRVWCREVRRALGRRPRTDGSLHPAEQLPLFPDLGGSS